jgi:transcriptional regulator with XRE-family HTH domain
MGKTVSNKSRIIGVRIGQLRESIQLSQVKFAKMIGISQSNLSKIEKGEFPSNKKEVLQRIAEVTGKTVAWICSDEERETDKNVDALFDDSKNISEYSREAVHNKDFAHIEKPLIVLAREIVDISDMLASIVERYDGDAHEELLRLHKEFSNAFKKLAQDSK